MPTSTLVDTPQSESLGNISRPHLICPCSDMTVESIAIVIWPHLVPPPEGGGSPIEPERSSTISRSGGSPFCSVKFCTPQLGSEPPGSTAPPASGLPPPPLLVPPDVQFIRNGKSYDAHAAAQHMRDKWKWKKSEIKTARDFIDVAASRSTETGKPYVIRWKDGHEQFSAAFLERELKKLEARPPN